MFPPIGSGKLFLFREEEFCQSCVLSSVIWQGTRSNVYSHSGFALAFWNWESLIAVQLLWICFLELSGSLCHLTSILTCLMLFNFACTTYTCVYRFSYTSHFFVSFVHVLQCSATVQNILYDSIYWPSVIEFIKLTSNPEKKNYYRYPVCC